MFLLLPDPPGGLVKAQLVSMPAEAFYSCRAGEEFHSMAVDLRGFYLKARVFIIPTISVLAPIVVSTCARASHARGLVPTFHSL